MPKPEQEEFARRVDRILERIERRERSAVAAALKLLERTRAEVIAQIASGGSDFNQFVRRQVEAAIGERIEEFRRDLTRQLLGDLNEAFELGVELADDPVSVVTRPIFGVGRQVAQVAAEISASLITDLSGSMRRQINAVLRRGALGALSTQEMIDQVGRSLDSPGRFRSLAARAETIVRTEVMRIQSIAAQVRMQENAPRVERAGYKLRKEWLATKDRRTRASHVTANGQIVELDEPFTVGGEKLQYPRDPRGSAKETINCRCVSKPVLAEGENDGRQVA